MPPSQVFVLGSTGPAGIVLLRELLSRSHRVVTYARTPSKIPSSLSANPLLTVHAGSMTDVRALTTAMHGCDAVISHLGARITDWNISPSLYVDMYRDAIVPAMRANGIKRVFLMGTMVMKRDGDKGTLLGPVVWGYMSVFARPVLRNLLDIQGFLEGEVGRELDWTVFRIAGLSGETGEESWRREREMGGVYVGPVGGKGWSGDTNRSVLARWLVDGVEGGKGEWVREMPAVTRLAGN